MKNLKDFYLNLLTNIISILLQNLQALELLALHDD